MPNISNRIKNGEIPAYFNSTVVAIKLAQKGGINGTWNSLRKIAVYCSKLLNLIQPEAILCEGAMRKPKTFIKYLTEPSLETYLCFIFGSVMVASRPSFSCSAHPSNAHGSGDHDRRTSTR